MEIRLSGKNDDSPGYKSLAAWIRKTIEDKEVLILKLGELQISIYPFDRNQMRELGVKLQELSGI